MTGGKRAISTRFPKPRDLLILSASVSRAGILKPYQDSNANRSTRIAGAVLSPRRRDSQVRPRRSLSRPTALVRSYAGRCCGNRLHPLAQSQNAGDTLCNLCCITKNVGLPKPQNRPTGSLQRLDLLSVTLNIPLELRNPILRVVTSREFAEPQRQVAAMPEVSVAEDCNAFFHKNNVWPAGQTTLSEAVPQASLPKRPAQNYFASSIRLSARGTRRS